MVFIINIFQSLNDKINKIKNIKEAKNVDKVKRNNNHNYLSKGSLKKKVQNSQSFTNIKEIGEDGIITLKSNQYAIFYKASPIDLSLTNKNEQELFFHTLSKLYRLPFTIKIYKFDENINLNMNKENYLQLLKKTTNKARRNLLLNNHDFIEKIENENMTIASSYYFAIIGKNKESLEKNKEEFELACFNVIPNLIIEQIKNKKNLIKIFCNMYFSNSNLDQVIYYDFIDLVSPLKISEQISNLKFDDEEVQLLSIKNYPLFIEYGFLDRIINLPHVKTSITINESIEQYKLINNLNSSFKAVLADYNSSKNLSDVTEMQTLMNNYKILIEQISSNDEKIKDVSIVLAISGNKKTRDELIRQIKRNAELYQIKVDIPKLRQMEAWQSYDLTDKPFKDYSMYLPTITLASTFFFTENYHNDTTGYLIGEDSAYGLPIFL